MEALEQRIAPANFLVVNAADSSSESLRQAIADSNAAPSPGGLAIQSLEAIQGPVVILTPLPPNTPETPGASLPSDTAGVLSGTVLAVLDSPFTDNAQPPFATGVLRSFVVDRDPTPAVALDFVYQLVNTSTGTRDVTHEFFRFTTIRGFDAGALEVANTNSLSGLVAGAGSGFVIGSYMQGAALKPAATADRDAVTPGSVGFDFPTQPPLPSIDDPRNIGQGEASSFLVVRTGNTTFATVPTQISGAATSTPNALAPLAPTGSIFVWDGGDPSDSTDWFRPLNWDRDNGVPGANDTAILNINSTINLPSSTSVGVFRQSDGTFTSPTGVTFTVLNSFDWSGGTMSGAGTAATLLPAGSVSTLSGAALKTLLGRALDVGGTLAWTGTGNFALNQGTFTVQSNGLFDIQNDALLGDANGNGTAASLIVAGTLRKSGGVGTSALGGNLGAGTGFVNITVNAGGAVRAETGTLQIDGVLNNNGLVNALGNTIVYTGASGSSAGTSGGTFNADAGGVVRVSGGVQTLTTGAALTGAGLFDIANGRVDIAPGANASATNVALSGASGTLGISGAIAISQTFDWTGGIIGGGGSVTLAPGSVSTISGAAIKSLSSGTFNVGGTLAWSGPGQFGASNGTLRVLNGGLFDLQSDAALGNNLGGVIALIVEGTLRKSAGVGTSSIDGANGAVNVTVNPGGVVEVQTGTLLFGDMITNNGTVRALGGVLNLGGNISTDTGTFNAAPGAVLRLSGATRTLDPGAAFTGAGLFEVTGALTLSTDITAQNLALRSGVIGGAGNLTISNSLDWTAGSMTGAGTTTLQAASVSTMSGTVDKTTTRNIDLFGTLTIDNSSSGTFAINSGTVRVRPGGLLDVKFVSIVDNDSGAAGNLVIDGTLRKSDVNDSASIGGRMFGTGSVNTTINAGGRVEVTGGALDFRGSGVNSSAGVFDIGGVNGSLTFNVPFTLNAGAAITGTGTAIVANNSTLTVAAPVSASGTLRLATGTTLALAAPLTQTGTFEWNGGTINGASAANLAALNIATASAKTLDAATLNLGGAGTWTGTGGLTMTQGAIFNIQNTATFDIQNDAAITLGAGAAPAINNAGTFKKTAGSTTSAIGVAFTNTGSVSAEDETLAFNGGFMQTAGSTTLAGGNLSSNSLMSFAGGELRGAGTIAANVNNSGATVRPGGTGTAGTLTTVGSYTQGAGGTLAIELGGTGAGQFDVLAVGTTATLGGTLAPSLINAFTPASGATFQVLTAAPRTGTFGTVTGQFTAQYNPGNVTLVAAPTGVFTWDGSDSSDWFDPDNWTPTGVPGATDTAILNIDSTISLPSSTSVGTFQQSNPPIVGANSIFTSLGGVTLTVLNSFTWSGGTQSGAGATTVGPGATLSIATSGQDVTLNQRTLNLDGNAIFPSSFTSGMALSNGATINNSGVLDFQGPVIFSGTGAFNNLAGATLKNTTTNHTVIVDNGIVFTNAGIVQSQIGTLAFNGGYVQNAGSTQLNGGMLSVLGTAFLNGGTLSGAGSIVGSILNVGAIIRPGGSGAAGTITINGDYTQGPVGTLEIEIGGAGAGQFDVFAPAGLATLDGILNEVLINGFTPAAGAQFVVLTFNQRSGSFATVNGPLTAQYNARNVTLLGPTAQIFTWDAGGADTSWFTPANWSPDGVPGASDTAILDTSATITLPNITNATVGTFQQSAGTLGGPGTLTVLTDFTWSGGAQAFGGTTTLGNGGTLTLSGAAKTLSRSLINDGTANWTGGAFAGVGTLINNGIFNASVVGAPFSPVFANANGATFFQLSALSSFQGPFSNSGVVNVDGGTLNLGSSGTSTHTGSFNLAPATSLNFMAGTHQFNGVTISGAGNVGFTGAVATLDSTTLYNVSGTTTVSGGTATFNNTNLVIFGTLDQSGGTLTGVANFQVDTAATWSGGTMSGAGTATTAAGATLTLSGAAKTLDRQFFANGPVNWTAGAVGGGSVFTNRNVFTATAGASFGAPFTNALGATFTQAAGTTTFPGAFSNGGTANIDAGTLALNGGSTTSGVMSLNGGTVSTPSALIFTSGGELRGVGTITGSVDNFSGVVRPGGTGAAGTITITGGYTQGSLGTLAVELGGTGAGQFDVLNVIGNATLDGTLNIAHLAGFTPGVGNSFRVVQSANNPTTFTTLTGQMAGIAQTADATGLTLARSAATFVWDAGGGADQSWFNPLNWNLDSGFPEAPDTAILGINAVIDLSAADATVATFQQSTGTLTGDQMLTVTGSLVWSGGTQSGTGTTTLASGGTGTLSGGVTLNGRTLDNAGAIVESGTLNFSGAGRFNNLASGVFDFARPAGGTVLSGAAGAAGFFNAGTVRHALAVTTSVSGPFTNQAGGIIDATQGTLNFVADGTWQGADFRIATGANCQFQEPHHADALRELHRFRRRAARVFGRNARRLGGRRFFREASR